MGIYVWISFFVETLGRIYGVGIPRECQGHTPAPEVFPPKIEHRTDGSIMKSKTIYLKPQVISILSRTLRCP